jgi:lambda family phage tail tape measure protein
VASINITVSGFETFLKIIAAVGVAYFAFGKATSFVWTTFDGIGKAVRASGGIFAMVGAEIAKFGSMIKSVFMNIGRAFGFFETAYGGVASLGFALSGVLRIGLRFLGWVGVFTAVGEAINWAIKQLTGFDALDAISSKLGALWDKAKSIVGLGDSGAGAGRGGNADTLKQQQAQGEESRKAWEAQQKAIEEAKAKAAEFAKRQAIINAEIAKTGDAFKIAGRESMSLIANQIELVGKSEDEVAMANALEEVYKRIRSTTEGLIEKRKEWALSGTPEQKASIGIIDAQIERVKALGATQLKETEKFMTELQSANLLEKDRIANIERITKAIDEQIKREEALAGARLGIIGQKQDVGFAKEQMGRSPFQQQAAEIVNNARKAALEAGRAYAAAFEDTGDGLTPERAKELADGLEAIRQGYADIATAQMSNLETSREWSQGWKEAFMAYTDSAQNAADQAKTYFDTFSRGAEDALVNFVRTGKLSFKDLANSLIADFARIQAKKAIAGLFSMGGGGSTGGFSFGSMFSSLGGLFGGGKASGGAVEAGKSFLVGERGPEMFTPNGSGTIIPNGALGGGQTVQHITYNIQATDAASFKAQLARDPSFLHAVVEQGRRSTPAGARR